MSHDHDTELPPIPFTEADLGTMYEEDKQAGGERVKRAGVANPARSGCPTSDGHKIVRGETGGLVDQQDAVRRRALRRVQGDPP